MTQLNVGRFESEKGRTTLTRLMVVDDEPEICDFLRSFFEDREFEVRSANSGEAALELLVSFQPQVVLLDIKMGGMDGLQTLQKIKEKRAKTRVIMVTAIETTDKIEEAMRLGADNYITKPLSLEYLENDVREKIAHLAQKGTS